MHGLSVGFTHHRSRLRARFEREAKTVSSLNHPNICTLFDIAESPGPDDTPTSYLVMEFVDGEDLASLIRRIGRLPREKAAEMRQDEFERISRKHLRDLMADAVIENRS